MVMSKVLTGRIRRVGNSMAVIVPKELLKEAGAREGDTVKLSLAIPLSDRNSAIRAFAGTHRRAKPFKREKRDRY
jgi:antitoxin component of MazEF toxin-antitoxin module